MDLECLTSDDSTIDYDVKEIDFSDESVISTWLCFNFSK